MDDLMTGSDNITDAVELQRQLIGLSEARGFKLSKWVSNNNHILESVPANEREIDTPLELHLDESIKTLGLAWNPSADCFQYRVNLPAASSTNTKRNILSEVASLFDPLGFLAPVVIAAKIFLQALWAEGVAWDQPLPQHLATRWLEYRGALPLLNDLNIPRWLGFCQNNKNHQLHGFCDASESAYAAVIYLKSIDSASNISVRLVTARTKSPQFNRLLRRRSGNTYPELKTQLTLHRVVCHLLIWDPQLFGGRVHHGLKTQKKTGLATDWISRQISTKTDRKRSTHFHQSVGSARALFLLQSTTTSHCTALAIHFQLQTHEAATPHWIYHYKLY